jgi:hypothetical protein
MPDNQILPRTFANSDLFENLHTGNSIMLPPSCCFGSPAVSEVEILYTISAVVPRKLVSLKAKEKVVFSRWNLTPNPAPDVRMLKQGFYHRLVFGKDNSGRPRELTSKELWKERLGMPGKGIQTVTFGVEIESPTIIVLYVVLFLIAHCLRTTCEVIQQARARK